MTVLALKLLLAPLLVVASSLAGRRWGPRVAGILIVLPVVAGPVLLILYLDHGSRFAAEAASAATLGIVPLALFAVVFGYLSRRHGWLLTLLASWLAVLATDLALAQVDVPVGAALVLALLALHAASALLRRLHPPPLPLPSTPWWDLPARAVATAVLVLLVTGTAASVGPALAGVLTPFPIALSVVCAFANAQTGHAGVLTLLRGIVPGLDGFALFCFLIAIMIDHLPAVVAFGTATAAAVGFAIFLVAKTPNHIARSAATTDRRQMHRAMVERRSREIDS
ncbi:MAG TPA: hypothetical protein VJ301_02460 [Propionibacteriaceae bacterium]|nr:hypothetical protein [Propionibacteriaceae bacterium]